jgi:hypothetical protein
MIDYIISNQIYLLYIAFIMLSVGMIKEHNLFNDIYVYLTKAFKSKRLIVALMSAFSGILPIPGRVTTSAGLLDTMAPDKGSEGREKYGIVDYLSTHHYYLWSPLEKTIIIPMGALGLTYGALMGMLAPMLVVSLALIVGYIFLRVKEEDVVIREFDDTNFKISRITRGLVPFLAAIGGVIYGVEPAFAFGALTLYYMIVTMTWDYKKLMSYINWEVIVWVFIIIALSNFARGYTNEIKGLLQNTIFDTQTLMGWVSLSVVSFGSAFALGSSSRFVALAVILASVYGAEYFVWFFAVEFAGYLLSPMHKCAAIGMTYFGTPFKRYASALGVWAVSVVGVAGVFTFV